MVRNLIYDPYNRSEVHNDFIKSEICRLRQLDAVDAATGVATVTIANVLNVIKSREDRKSVLLLAQAAWAKWVYITVYEGDKGGITGETRDGWQEHRKLKMYLDEVREVFEKAEVIGKLFYVTSSSFTHLVLN